MLRDIIERVLKVRKEIYLRCIDFTWRFDRVKHMEIINELR